MPPAGAVYEPISLLRAPAPLLVGVERTGIVEQLFEHFPGLLDTVGSSEEAVIALERIFEEARIGVVTGPFHLLVIVVGQFDRAAHQLFTRFFDLGRDRDPLPRLHAEDQVIWMGPRRVRTCKEKMRGIGKLEQHFRGGRRHLLACPDEEGDTSPTPRVDVESQGGKALGVRFGGDALLPSVALILAPNHLLLADGPDRSENLDLLVSQCFGISRYRRFHGHQRHQLKEVVLNHVANRTHFVIEAPASFHTEALGHCDLDPVDVMPVPCRLEEGVGQTEHEQVEYLLLAQEVVDPEDGVLSEVLQQASVEPPRRVEVASEGLLDYNMRFRGKTGFGEKLHNRLEEARRHRQIEEHPVVTTQISRDAVIGLGFAIIATGVVKGGRQPLERLLLDICFVELLDRLTRELDETIVVPVPSSDSYDLLRQATIEGQLIESRIELSTGEITGGTEENEGVAGLSHVRTLSGLIDCYATQCGLAARMAAVSDQPISAHALLSDWKTAALVDLDGSIEWWCTPTFDSPSVFGRILDPGAGHFSIKLKGVEENRRRYVEGTLVLETVMSSPEGEIELIDALAVGESEEGHEVGLSSPGVLLRGVRCTRGKAVVEVEFAPRFEYGLTTPLMVTADGQTIARGGPMTLKLSTTADLEVRGSIARAEFTLSEGERVGFALQTESSWLAFSDGWSPEQINNRIDDTIRAWVSWGDQHQNYEGPYADLVTHSGRVLQGLTYRSTGAMIAAPTTSLPEVVGGKRNWDYRYCWIRDASFTLRALWVAACPDEAGTYLDYLTVAASSIYKRDQMQIMFGIDGRRDLTERVLPWLRGWRDSAPVRIGNGAWNQPQHDVYGELLSSVSHLVQQIGELDRVETRFLVDLADKAEAVWNVPDHGIWEIRGEPRHYLHSKLMCWAALDHAITMADHIDGIHRLDSWMQSREEIREAIQGEGWSDEVGAFTQVLDGGKLDASALVIPIVGFLPFDDDRVLATIDAVRSELSDERGLIYRYRSDDGLDGDEGAFLLCTFWLAEALAGAGRVSEAREVFEFAASYRNDVDLMAEEVDRETGEMIGNFPQAFSHVGLINAAWAIKLAEEGTP